MYIHLTTHSAYSLQEGLLSPIELVQAARIQGISALGLADHHLLNRYPLQNRYGPPIS